MRLKQTYNLNTVSSSYIGKIYSKIIPFSLIILILSTILLYSYDSKNTTKEIQEGIASQIIRFHVIANSDSSADQALKLKIKDALTESLRPTLQNVKDIEEARALLTANLNRLESISNQIIKENGYTYTASASLERGYFPLKVYGDLSLPPGEYEAVRIELGSAKGKNWWCIMYPPLCFVDATYSIVPDSSKEQLKYLLTEEEYTSLFIKNRKDKNVNIKIKFKLIPALNKLTAK
jgi:stage II sporulation protein R